MSALGALLDEMNVSGTERTEAPAQLVLQPMSLNWLRAKEGGIIHWPLLRACVREENNVLCLERNWCVRGRCCSASKEPPPLAGLSWAASPIAVPLDQSKHLLVPRLRLGKLV